MIQRIQTIYLLLAFTCSVLLIIFPLFSVTAQSNGLDESVSVSAEFGAYGLAFTDPIDSSAENQTAYQSFDGLADDPSRGKFPVYTLYISMSLLTLAALLMYKKRKRQLFFARLGAAVHVLIVIGVMAFYYFGVAAIKKMMPAVDTVTVSFNLEIGFYLLVATLPFLFLAIRGIKHDENLIKSLDRLR